MWSIIEITIAGILFGALFPNWLLLLSRNMLQVVNIDPIHLTYSIICFALIFNWVGSLIIKVVG